MHSDSCWGLLAEEKHSKQFQILNPIYRKEEFLRLLNILGTIVIKKKLIGQTRLENTDSLPPYHTRSLLTNWTNKGEKKRNEKRKKTRQEPYYAEWK